MGTFSRGKPKYVQQNADASDIVIMSLSRAIIHAMSRRRVVPMMCHGTSRLQRGKDEEHVRLLDFYAKVDKAIRAVDPHHILFLE